MLTMNVLNVEIGMARGEQVSLCSLVNGAHWQRCQSLGRNKKDGRGAADEAYTAPKVEHSGASLQIADKN